MTILKMDADISQTVAQENLIKMQARQVHALTSKTLADASQAWHDYDYFKTTQQPSTGQGLLSKEIGGILGISGSDVIKHLKNELFKKQDFPTKSTKSDAKYIQPKEPYKAPYSPYEGRWK